MCGGYSYEQQVPEPEAIHKHEWFYVPGGDVSITRAREMGVTIPDHIQDEGLPYAVFVAGYWACTGCDEKAHLPCTLHP